MTLRRRLGCLESAARGKAESGYARRLREDPERAYFEATGRPRPEVFGRYEQAVERFRAALKEARAANPGASRTPDTPELTAAHDEMLRIRNELRAFSRELGNERSGDS